MENILILAINPGSTSTKIAVFKNKEQIFTKNIKHSNEELEPFEKITDQFEFRKDVIHQVLKDEGIKIDDIHIVISLIGPGVHLAAKFPERPIPEELQQRASSLAQYGVEFHACGNTLKSLDWANDNMADYVTVVEVGAADLMELQEQGYAYISW